MTNLNIKDISIFDGMTDKASAIVIVTHQKPDGDAIGSSVGMMKHLLKHKRADVRIVLNDRYPDNLGFLIGKSDRDRVIIHEDCPEDAIAAIQKADLIIALDFNAFHRTDRLEDALSRSTARKILIDHHLSPDRDRFDLVFSETEVSSASELTYHILKASCSTGGDTAAIPAEAATALMTGMTTDTNNFGNSVYPSTLRMASELIEAGVDRERILECLYNQFGEKRLRLLGHIMKDLMRVTSDGVAYVVLDKETLKMYEVNEGDTEGFVNMPLSIKRVRMSIMLKEDGERIRVSIRSKKGTSANRCARMYFNGGGHENAAGGRLYPGKEVTDIRQAGNYIETHTHKFFTEDEK